jgi:VCBS repeat-containing protein
MVDPAARQKVFLGNGKANLFHQCNADYSNKHHSSANRFPLSHRPLPRAEAAGDDAGDFRPSILLRCSVLRELLQRRVKGQQNRLTATDFFNAPAQRRPVLDGNREMPPQIEQRDLVNLLSEALGVSAITIKRAYLDLETEGYILTRAGLGSFVAAVTIDALRDRKLDELRDKFALDVTVTPVNDAPMANGDSYTTNQDTPLTVSAPGVLNNDTDVERDPLSAALVSGPSHGTLKLNSNGSFTYSPAANYNGADSFTYKANDGQADSNVATVTIVDHNPVPVISSLNPVSVTVGSPSFTLQPLTACGSVRRQPVRSVPLKSWMGSPYFNWLRSGAGGSGGCRRPLNSVLSCPDPFSRGLMRVRLSTSPLAP